MGFTATHTVCLLSERPSVETVPQQWYWWINWLTELGSDPEVQRLDCFDFRVNIKRANTFHELVKVSRL